MQQSILLYIIYLIVPIATQLIDYSEKTVFTYIEKAGTRNISNRCSDSLLKVVLLYQYRARLSRQNGVQCIASLLSASFCHSRRSTLRWSIPSRKNILSRIHKFFFSPWHLPQKILSVSGNLEWFYRLDHICPIMIRSRHRKNTFTEHIHRVVPNSSSAEIRTDGFALLPINHLILTQVCKNESMTWAIRKLHRQLEKGSLISWALLFPGVSSL